MKLLFKLLVVCLLCFSCDDALDINTDPTAPTDVTKEQVLTAGQASLATVMGGALTNLGGFWAQYHTQAPGSSQYEELDSYNLNTDFADRFWRELYAGCLNDLAFVVRESQASNDTGTEFIATLLQVYTYQVLTDLFGDILYTNALQGEVDLNPEVTEGAVIYADLLVTIDEALAKYNANPTPTTAGAQDVIYNGNMDDWIRFANTLKLKIHVRMAGTSQENSDVVRALLSENNFITSNAAFAIYIDETNRRNPFYDVQIDNFAGANNIASNTLLSFYQENSDPRINGVYLVSEDGGSFSGIDQGSSNDFSGRDDDDYSKPNVTPTTPVYLLTVMEADFLQAEAAVRYAGGTGAAALYANGIQNSFVLYGLNSSDADPLTTSGGAYEYLSSGTMAEQLRQIQLQKWAALAYINNIEAFFEINRTGVPEIIGDGSHDYELGNRIPSQSSVLGGTNTPLSLFYPSTEVTRNRNITQKPNLLQPVWWDQ